MTEWFRQIDPRAESEDDTVLLYSLPTEEGTLQIVGSLSAFNILPYRSPDPLIRLRFAGMESDRRFKDVFAALKAAYRGESGISEWDCVGVTISDYLGDWEMCVGRRILFNYFALWIEKNPGGTLRSMDDYFRRDRMSLVDRHDICAFLEEMLVSGQLQKLPGDWLTPSEYDGVLRLAKEYGVEITDNRYA